MTEMPPGDDDDDEDDDDEERDELDAVWFVLNAMLDRQEMLAQRQEQD